MIGDLHNGGLAVRRVQAPDGRFWFHKPRTVFWEHLFFGKASPLKSHWSKPDVLFNLDVECSTDRLSGKSLGLASSHAFCSDAFFNFGYLIGYAYLFGIQDLFRENVICSDSGILPIDVEIVFSKFFLPHESSLLPFKQIGVERSALGALVEHAGSLSPDAVFEILRGYLTLLKDAFRASTVILDVLDDLALSDVPVRILLRPTYEYMGVTRKTHEFFREEQLQIEAGDVPYFFKYLGDESVYFYSERVMQRMTSNLPKQMEDGLQNLAVNPVDLLAPERISQTLMPTGSLYLLRKLLPSDYQGVFAADDVVAEINADSIKIKFELAQFSCKR